jgi:capsular polysaccharide biosynthesis protein
MQPIIGSTSSHPSPSVSGSPEFDYAPGQPNLYLMMRRKQELVRAHGVDDGFAIFRRQFRLSQNAGLRPLTIESERDFAKNCGGLFVETAPARQAFAHQPPLIVGEGNQRPLHGVTRSQYVACLADARVRGRSATVEVNRHLLLDHQDDEMQRLDDEPEWDSAIFHAKDTRGWLIDENDSAAVTTVDEAFTLIGAHTDFFGHWMCEYLPKYAAAKLSGALPDVPLLLDSFMPSSHRASLELLYPECRLIEVPAFKSVQVARLWCAPALSYQPLHERRNERFSWDAIAASPERFAPVIRELQGRLDRAVGISSGPERVYFARRSFRHRRLVNCDAIERVARELGFELFYPEDLPFTEQAVLARNARVIVAPEGSALFLSMFARPQSKVCILSHPLTDVLADYNGILAAHEIEVMAITGPISRADDRTPHNSDYRLDEDVFRREAERL